MLQNGFDARNILGIVQLPEHLSAALDDDASNLDAIGEETQLLQPFVDFEAGYGPGCVGR